MIFQLGTGQDTQNQDLLASVLVPNSWAALQSGKSKKNMKLLLRGQRLIQLGSDIN